MTLLSDSCEDAWFFKAADAVKVDRFSEEREGSVHEHGTMCPSGNSVLVDMQGLAHNRQLSFS